jgi:chromosome segregation ATPase
MRRTARSAACFLLLGVVWGALPALSQQPAAAEELARQMAGVNRSLTEISSTLQSLLRNQRIDLQLRRIELTERRLAPARSQLRSLASRQKNDEEELATLQKMLEQVGDQIAQSVAEGREADVENEREMQGHLQFELERIEERIEATRLERIELENDLARRERTIGILEEQLDELLEELADER